MIYHEGYQHLVTKAKGFKNSELNLLERNYKTEKGKKDEEKRAPLLPCWYHDRRSTFWVFRFITV